jgi:hypothetical protein
MLHTLFTKDIRRATLEVVEHGVGPGGHPVNYKREGVPSHKAGAFFVSAMLLFARHVRQRLRIVVMLIPWWTC